METRRGVGAAGGKVILVGEHAVVHGTSSLAVAIGDRVRVEAVSGDGPIVLDVPAWGLRARVDGGDAHDRALRGLVMALKIDGTGVRLTGQADIPARAGLGASAAIAAASGRALWSFLGTKPDNALLFEAVQASEKIYHRDPSGLDASVVINGGILTFSRQAGARRVDAPPPPLVVIHSGEPGDTRVTVDLFAKKLADEPARGGRRLEQIGGLVDEAVAAMKVWDLPTIGAIMNENHRHLQWFGVSTKALDLVCTTALRAGALGAKLTGGGGGGCAVALVTPEFTESVTRAVTAAGFQVIST